MKKKSTKILLVVFCAVLLVLGSVMGTVAYLTSDASVENTFTVGDVEITLLETDVDVYGVKDGDTRVAANQYKLLPGREYVKDPEITVTKGSEECWLFVVIDNGIEAFEAADNTIADQLADNDWTPVATGSNIYYHAKVNALDAAQTVPVFEGFTIADEADAVTGWDAISAATTKVTVTAYAIQADGMPTFTDAARALDLID